jgi:hypothetical protein
MQLLNEELSDEYFARCGLCFAKDAGSSTNPDHLSKITPQKPDFVNLNEV